MTGDTATLEVQPKKEFKIDYNVPFEVTQSQYNDLMKHFAGIVAGREEEGKYYIKVWITAYNSSIINFLKNKK